MNNLPVLSQKNSINNGDIYKLGNHFLGCGKAEDERLLEKMLQGRKINCVVSDPPYASGTVESKDGFVKLSNETPIINDHLQSEIQYLEFTGKWLKTVHSNLEYPNTFYIFNSDKMIFAVKQALEKEGGKFSQLLIWAKNHNVIGRLDYNPMHELIAYGWFGKHEFYKSKDKSILCYPKPQKSKLHPTMKPVALIRHLILNSSRIGDIVWDGFGGSGTTLLACEQTKRVCVMTEISPLYCQTIIDRFHKVFPNLSVEKVIL
ncbi:site-specific DNA-methyltransferase [Candidatus Microgenomates bacterium]|nr:MAG: site-specific DNA-methyltransferase [Candidatus Microgenomates bacterium]